MKPSEMLRAACKLIEKPENWTKGMLGFGQLRKLSSNIEQGRGCAVGACLAATENDSRAAQAAIAYLDRDAQHYGFKFATSANDADATTHKQVLWAFDRCIKAAEAAGE